MAKKFQYLYRTFNLEQYDERDEFDDFERLLNQYGDQGYEIMSIDVEASGSGKVIHVIMKKEK